MPLSEQTTRRRRRPGERAATMVETALVLPLFLLLIYGIIEFSFAFAQSNELRHVAREAARLATVDANDVATGICSSFDLIDPTTVTLTFSDPVAIPGDGTGATATVTATATYHSMTGLLDGFLGDRVLETSHVFYIEEPTFEAGPVWGSCS